MHNRIALEIIEYLHQRYPDASIGISGSVAKGTYRHDSDIDILFLRKSILSSYFVTFKYKEINVSIFIFSPGLIEENDMKYLCGYHNMPITFITISKIIYDPYGAISNLKEIINNIVRRKVILSKLLVGELKKNALNLLDLTPRYLYEEKKIIYAVCNIIISIYYLKKHPNRITLKKEGRNPFPFLEKENKELYKKIKHCIPYKPNSYGMLQNTLVYCLSL